MASLRKPPFPSAITLAATKILQVGQKTSNSVFDIRGQMDGLNFQRLSSWIERVILMQVSILGGRYAFCVVSHFNVRGFRRGKDLCDNRRPAINKVEPE